jgi:hypothetical protein
MTNEWSHIEGYIENILVLAKDRLEQDAVDSVEHYLAHAEYEMAFELLFLELFKLRELPSIDLKDCIRIAEQLKLNEETVYDVEFWEKLNQFCSKKL